MKNHIASSFTILSSTPEEIGKTIYELEREIKVLEKERKIISVPISGEGDIFIVVRVGWGLYGFNPVTTNGGFAPNHFPHECLWNGMEVMTWKSARKAQEDAALCLPKVRSENYCVWATTIEALNHGHHVVR